MADRSPEELLAIFKLTHFYQMHDEHALCHAALTNHPNFDPAHKLLSAQNLAIAEWREPALRALLHIGTDKLTAEQKVWLHSFELEGHAFYVVLAETTYSMLRHRLQVAERFVKPLQDDTCVQHERCITNWGTAWTRGFLPHWLHSSKGCTEEAAIAMLKATSITMFAPCRLTTLVKLEESVFVEEKKKVAALLERLANE